MVMIPLIAMEVYVEHLPNPAKSKHQWMLSHSQEVETLILGNSHTFYGLRPDVLGGNAINLAMVSQTYRYDNALLHHYDMPHLRRVILPCSYLSLWEDFEEQEDNKEWYMANRYLLYMDIHEHSRLSKYGLEMFSINSLWEKTLSLWRPSQVSWDSLGFGTNFTREGRNEEWDNGAERARNNTYKDTCIVALNKQYLNEMATFCKKHNAQLILITTPTSQSFRNNEDQRQVNINKKTLSDFLCKHPSVMYIDLEADKRFSEEDFYDGDHLNMDGAEKMSMIIRDSIM